MSARAISSSLRWPPESDPAKSSAFAARLNLSSSTVARSLFFFSCDFQVKGNTEATMLSPVWPPAPRSMLSITVSRDRLLVSWKVRTIPLRARRCGGVLVIVAPAKVHVPPSALSKPLRTLKNVDLPAPLGPMSAVIAPF